MWCMGAKIDMGDGDHSYYKNTKFYQKLYKEVVFKTLVIQHEMILTLVANNLLQIFLVAVFAFYVM